MGIYSRDYIRDDSAGGRSVFSAGGWAVKYLIIANVVVFVLNAFSGHDLLTKWFELKVPVKIDRDAIRSDAIDGSIEPGRDVLSDQRDENQFSSDDDPNPQTDARSSKGRWYIIDDDLVVFAPGKYVRIDWNAALQMLWRIFTYGFCHGGIGHLVFNMYALWMFGQAIEGIYGSKEFLGMYLLAVAVSGLCHVLVALAQHSGIGVIGASGGVMAVVILAALHYPRMLIYLMMVVPIELRWLAVIYVAVDLLGLVGGSGGVSNAAHLGGAAFALAYYRFGWRVTGWLGTLSNGVRSAQRWRFGRKKVRIYEPTPLASDEPPTSLEEQVDAILEKIHVHGETSLTDRERETLKKASHRYKNRR